MRKWRTTFFPLVTGGGGSIAEVMCRAMVHTSQVQMPMGQSGFVAYAYQARVIAGAWY